MWLHPRVLFEVSKWSLTWSFKEWAASVNWRQVQSNPSNPSQIFYFEGWGRGRLDADWDDSTQKSVETLWLLGDGRHQVLPSVTSLRPPASSQDWLLISLEMGDMGKGIKRSARVNSDSYLGREFGREVRGTTAVILQGKRKDTFWKIGLNILLPGFKLTNATPVLIGWATRA